ncbi:PilZ domain-containing protein [Marinobacter salicampi]|uniref:PilZ domain-containing protein n=1 Tax=Marinobacter salicampi TaxID=435907 RepID=UPI001409B942|nr:PilZ domain-containing protein [Marinobacter salicampi]
MGADLSTDRRDYFRIQDCIGLEYIKLPNDQDDATIPFGEDRLAGLRDELKRIDLDVRNQLASLADKDRLLSNLLKSLNHKVDALARIMAFEQNPLQQQDWQRVTLSEGGVAFDVSAGALAVGDLVALRMTLPPELYRPEAVAQVVDVAPEDTGTTRVHTEFTRLYDSDRQQIAKHIMRWQIRARQQNETE